MAVSLIERLREQGLTIEVRSVFLTPTLKEMAVGLASGVPDAAADVPANLIPGSFGHPLPAADECEEIRI
jgi:hypothetical protein